MKPVFTIDFEISSALSGLPWYQYTVRVEGERSIGSADVLLKSVSYIGIPGFMEPFMKRGLTGSDIVADINKFFPNPTPEYEGSGLASALIKRIEQDMQGKAKAIYAIGNDPKFVEFMKRKGYEEGFLWIKML